MTELLTVFKLVLTVVTFVLTEFSKLLMVFKLVLTVVTFVLTAFSKLLIVLRFVLTIVTFVLTALTRLLTVVRLLLIVKTAPVFGIAVKSEASPINLPYMEPDESVEKKPKLVDVVIAEVFETVRR